MWRAVRPFAATHPIAPLAARDGAIAEELLAAASGAAVCDRVIVRVGDCMAVHLTPGFGFRRRCPPATTSPAASRDPCRGHGARPRAGSSRRPPSGLRHRRRGLGHRPDGGQGRAAAAVLADAVDIAGHPAIARVPADLLEPGSPYGTRPMVRAVGRLSDDEVAAALEGGLRRPGS